MFVGKLWDLEKLLEESLDWKSTAHAALEVLHNAREEPPLYLLPTYIENHWKVNLIPILEDKTSWSAYTCFERLKVTHCLWVWIKIDVVKMMMLFVELCYGIHSPNRIKFILLTSVEDSPIISCSTGLVWNVLVGDTIACISCKPHRWLCNQISTI